MSFNTLADFKGLTWDPATMPLELFGITGLLNIIVIEVGEEVGADEEAVWVWLNEDGTINDVHIG